MSELRIALLGSGYMGQTYAECITRYNTRARLVAIWGGSRAPGLGRAGVEGVPQHARRHVADRAVREQQSREGGAATATVGVRDAL